MLSPAFKSLLHAYCTELKADLHDGLPWLLLAAREVVQESTGFSPNEPVFAHTVHGPLSVIRDQWVMSDPPKNLISYVGLGIGFMRLRNWQNKICQK